MDQVIRSTDADMTEMPLLSSTRVEGRWSVVGGRWSVVGGRWSMVGGRWSVAEHPEVVGRLLVDCWWFEGGLGGDENVELVRTTTTRSVNSDCGEARWPNVAHARGYGEHRTNTDERQSLYFVLCFALCFVRHLPVAIRTQQFGAAAL